MPVDSHGVKIGDHAMRDRTIRMAYVTPSHQWPTGVSLSAERRQQLLEWASNNGSWIVEDDYDSEFSYTRKPLSSLQGIDKNQLVIYAGTFSKVLVPSLQMAYLVVPKRLTSVFTRAAYFTCQRPPIHYQLALTEFINEGFFTSHIRRMRQLYDNKQAMFVEALKHHLSDEFNFQRPSGGLQLFLPLPESIPADQVSKRAAAVGLHVRTMAIYAANKSQAPNGLHLGFAAVPGEDIDPKTRLLAQSIAKSR